RPDDAASTLGGILGGSLGRTLGQLRAHQLMQQVHRLERTHHHLEMRDLAFGEADDVDAVDRDAVDFFFEFEHGAGVTAPFAGIFEAFAASTCSALARYLKVMSRPRCGVWTTGLSNTASGCSRSQS